MSGELRAATWNVHQWVGGDGRRDMDRCMTVLAGMALDVAGLQEASIPDEGGLDRFCRELGMEAVAGPTLRRTHGRFGNVLLTRLAVESVERHDISVARREPRGVVDAVLSDGRRRLRAVVTHFGLRAWERKAQAVGLLELLRIRDQGLPTLLMGDCNEWRPWSRPMRRLVGWFGGAPWRWPRTWPARLPVFALDRILCRPSGLLGRPWAVPPRQARLASDHLPLAAVMQWED